MKYFVIISVIFFTASCMIKQQKTLKDELPTLESNQVYQIKVIELQDSSIKTYTTPDSINYNLNLYLKSKRELAKFYPTHKIYFYLNDSVVELSYRERFINYKGITFKIPQELSVP